MLDIAVRVITFLVDKFPNITRIIEFIELHRKKSRKVDLADKEIQAELIKAKTLFDDKLIDEDDYKDLRKKIIENYLKTIF